MRIFIFFKNYSMRKNTIIGNDFRKTVLNVATNFFINLTYFTVKKHLKIWIEIKKLSKKSFVLFSFESYLKIVSKNMDDTKNRMLHHGRKDMIFFGFIMISIIDSKRKIKLKIDDKRSRLILKIS